MSANSSEYDDGQRIADLQARVANLETALATARRIGAAVGIVMATHGVAEEDAFKLLVRSSNTSARKLRDVAEQVLHNGALLGMKPQPIPVSRSCDTQGKGPRP